MTMPEERGVLPFDWAVPAVNDTNRAWFTSGELALQQCASCATVQHPPEETCHVCGAMRFVTRTVAPFGTVYSYTVVHHAVHPALGASIPYAVVLVRLDEQPDVRVVGNLLDVAVDDVAIGMPVEATWELRTADEGDEVLLPQWRKREPSV
jgi:uncharacterized OB-fold protein